MVTVVFVVNQTVAVVIPAAADLGTSRVHVNTRVVTVCAVLDIALGYVTLLEWGPRVTESVAVYVRKESRQHTVIDHTIAVVVQAVADLAGRDTVPGVVYTGLVFGTSKEGEKKKHGEVSWSRQ